MFNEGDIVRLRNGRTPMRVTRVRGSMVYAVYCNVYRYHDPETDTSYGRSKLVLVTNPAVELQAGWEKRLTQSEHETLMQQTILINPKKETEKMTQLYQTNETPPRFCIKLATNSIGQLVMEMKATNIVEVFNPSEVEKVRPYTVGLKALTDSTRIIHVIAKKGSVEVGDIVILSTKKMLMSVTALDTGDTTTNTVLRGRKLATTEIEAAASDPDDTSSSDDDLLSMDD